MRLRCPNLLRVARPSGDEVHPQPADLGKVDDAGEPGGVRRRSNARAGDGSGTASPQSVQLDDDEVLAYQRDEVRVNNVRFEKLTRETARRSRKADGSLLVCLDPATP